VPDYLGSPTCWTLFFGCLGATAALTPVVIALAKGSRALDFEPCRTVYEESMPLMGGLAIAAPFLVVCALGIVGATGMLRELESARRELLVLAVGAAAIAGVGLVDDILGLRARYRLLGQVAVAVFVCVFGGAVHSISLPTVGAVEFARPLGFLLTVLWIVALTNVLTLLHGLDHLATGLSFLGILALGIIATFNGTTLVVVLSISLSGSLLAFFALNLRATRILLGHTGAYFLGFCLAAISLFGSHKTTGTLIFLAPLLVLALPVPRTLLSVLRRGAPGGDGPAALSSGRRPRARLSARRIALALVLAAASCLVMAMLVSLGPATSWWLSGGALAFYAFIFFAVVGIAAYLRPIKDYLERRRRDSLLRAFARYGALHLNAESGPRDAHAIVEIARQELRLQFLEFWFKGRDWPIVASTYPEADQHDLPIKQFETPSAAGLTVVTRYQHDHDPDEDECRAVAACLTDLFAQLSQDLPPPRVAEPQPASAGAPEPAASEPALEILRRWRQVRRRIA
jgi:UDP-GlcNAc:undecaprenyl-phosphate GlcNAc-1-phosphate transferase